jgi:hypothetical protein
MPARTIANRLHTITVVIAGMVVASGKHQPRLIEENSHALRRSRNND